MRERQSFRLCITNLDYVLESPGELDRSESAFAQGPLTHVPVIRVYGATRSGQRCCLHVHNVFPYCYVAYDGPLEAEEGGSDGTNAAHMQCCGIFIALASSSMLH